MSVNNSLADLVAEYKETYLSQNRVYDLSLQGEVECVKDALLDEKFKPSLQLKQILKGTSKNTSPAFLFYQFSI